MDNLSVIIPAFNEGRRIAPTIDRILGEIARWRPYEIIVVDDGSTDATRDIVTGMARDGLPVRLLCQDRNKGKGAALRLGVGESRGELVLLTDADLATPISELTKLVGYIEGGADAAIGSRALDGSRIVVQQTTLRQWSGQVFNLLVRFALLPGICDTQCGFKLFRGAVARSLFAESVVDGYAVDVEILSLAVRAGLAVVEVPVEWSHMDGSKVQVYPDGARMAWDVFGLWRKLWLKPAFGAVEQVALPERVAPAP